VPLWGGGAGSPSNTMWPGPRPTCMPSFILIRPTIWPQCTNVTDRQTGPTEKTDRTTDRSHRANRFTNGRPKTVRPMLSDRCLSVPSFVLSSLSCPVCNVGVLWPNGWMDQDKTWHGGRPRPRPHCVRWELAPPPKRGHMPRFSTHVYCDQMGD